MYELDVIECERNFEDHGVALRSVDEVRVFHGSLCDSDQLERVFFCGMRGCVSNVRIV